jgi:hypothetical protein
MVLSLGDLDTFLVTGDTVIAAPALAGLKESVFQITMAEFDPPTGVSASQGLTARLITPAANLALLTVVSRESLARLCRVKILRSPVAA